MVIIVFRHVTKRRMEKGLLALPKTLAQPTQFLFQDVEPFSGVGNDQTSTTVNVGLWTSNTHKDGPVLSL